VVLVGVTCASALAADTIVLKNGRRIIATNVVEVGDRVTYDTPAGQMSIPKSIVDRIDRDGFTFNSSAAAAPPPVSAPEIEPVRGYEDISAKAVRDNAIDFSYLAQLETDARSGNRIAVDKVTAAHYAAAQFLTAKGDTTAAVEQYRQGLSFAPDNMGLLLNLAVLYLRQSQFASALDPLEHARRLDPNSADVAKLTGWAYYGANKIDLAVAEWKRAEKIHPDPDIEHALAKAERDKNEEESYREGETEHFVLKYSGSATPDLARGILRVLEDDFNDIESQLDFTPPEPIGVILYTNQTFADITQAPGWAGAINRAGIDGGNPRTGARPEARADTQLRGAEDPQPRSHVVAGRSRAIYGRTAKRDVRRRAGGCGGRRKYSVARVARRLVAWTFAVPGVVCVRVVACRG
jgi:predicted negative regulator of RcsB-dependent stress response